MERPTVNTLKTLIRTGEVRVINDPQLSSLFLTENAELALSGGGIFVKPVKSIDPIRHTHDIESFPYTAYGSELIKFAGGREAYDALRADAQQVPARQAKQGMAIG